LWLRHVATGIEPTYAASLPRGGEQPGLHVGIVGHRHPRADHAGTCHMSSTPANHNVRRRRRRTRNSIERGDRIAGDL